MISLQTVILCISIAFFGLTLQESEAKSHSFNIPLGHDLSNLDLSKLDGDKKYKIPGTTHTHHYQLPGKNVTHTHEYKKPGMTNIHHYRYKKPGHTVKHTYRYKEPGKYYELPGKNVTHTHEYKKPGMTHVHHYRYKKPGHTVKHTHRYKEPGKFDTHTYRYRNPGKIDIHHYRYRNPESHKSTTDGIFYVINVIYNYFAVGGRLTGIPAFDLLLLRYYVAEGPRNFCPN